jgi:aspartate racemase
MGIVGIVGGLGPESTIDYYRRLLEEWKAVDADTSPSIVIDSLDVQRALRLVASDRTGLIAYLLDSVRRLAAAGADFVAMTANTPHLVFDELVAESPVPMLSIVQVCAAEARHLALRRPLLLGTRFTMEAPFYARVFEDQGMTIVTPTVDERTWVHDRYVNQLLKGDFRDATRAEFVGLIERLHRQEAVDAVILGGTELPLLLKTESIAGIPTLDTTALHVRAIVERLRALQAPGG